jgi:DNA-binding PadR family transcriptional regulator
MNLGKRQIQILSYLQDEGAKSASEFPFDVTRNSIYAQLRVLESYKFVASFQGDKRTMRGGKRRRMFILTDKGEAELIKVGKVPRES